VNVENIPERRRREFGTLVVVLTLLGSTMFIATPAAAQDAEHTDGSEESEYRHGLAAFVGGITRTERGDSGFAFGVGYTYGAWRRWAVGVKFEHASGSIERDWLLLAGVVFEPVDRLELGFSAGPESVDKAVLEHGEPVVEQELELLLRFTVGYALFRLNERMTISPEFNVDLGSQVSLVYGLTFSLGL